jgi:4'-phosphopantetheinyl transferase
MSSTDECWWRPFRKTDRAAVFHVDLTPHTARERAAVARLDKQERARWQRYPYARPRREFALCRAALRALLCGRLDCRNAELTFGAAQYGKPFALVNGTSASICFNISHSGAHGLIAFAAAGRIGVDVEERIARRDLDGISQTVFTPGERAALAATSGERKVHLFFSLWTLKEALIKALGSGFSLDPSRFEIPPAMCRGLPMSIFRFPHLPAVGWRLENLDNADFSAALAHELEPGPTE